MLVIQHKYRESDYTRPYIEVQRGLYVLISVVRNPGYVVYNIYGANVHK